MRPDFGVNNFKCRYKKCPAKDANFTAVVKALDVNAKETSIKVKITTELRVIFVCNFIA
jgi:hypothetical protein